MPVVSEKFFLGRQPILDRYQEIVGYELLFRAADVDRAVFESYSHASASVISHALASFGMREVLGGQIRLHQCSSRPAFVGNAGVAAGRPDGSGIAGDDSA